MSSEDYDVGLSKALSLLLRVNKPNIPMDNRGFCLVKDVLNLSRFKGYNVDNLLNIVDKNDKKRFSIEGQGNNLKIRANNAHYIPNINPDLVDITNWEDFQDVIHETTYSAYELIKFEGINRMERTSISFYHNKNEYDRKLDILIYIDLKKALKDDFKFFLTINNYIQCNGNEEGLLPTKYFKRVYDKDKKKDLFDYVPNFDKELKTISLSKRNQLIHPSTRRLFSQIKIDKKLSKTKGRYVNFLSEETPNNPQNYELLIYINIKKLPKNIQFYKFSDNEILSLSDIEMDCIQQVIDTRKNTSVFF